MSEAIIHVDPFEGPKRYVPDARARFAALKAAAQEYPEAVASGPGLGWMRRKPFDDTPGHPHFFNNMYAALNAIQAMVLPPRALVVEVGAGPGWLTQILAGLGYQVVAIEPSSAMNDISAQRLKAFAEMIGVRMDTVTLETATLEEADIAPYVGRVDGVIFHEALHHVINENESLQQVFSLLRPGGCLAVCGEGRWIPGDRHSERQLDEEMERYGTLESPFTKAYLRHLLEQTGFIDVVFYHSVNGLFPETMGTKQLAEVANPPESAANSVVAWRPLVDGVARIPRVTRSQERTAAQISLSLARWTGETLSVQVRLHNVGETYWPIHQPPSQIGVTLALTQGSTDLVPPPEASNRCPLKVNVLPGQEIAIDWDFDVRGLDRARCLLRLVAEDAFWFEGGLPVPPPA